MHTSKLFRLVGVLFALGLLAGACSSSDDGDVAAEGNDDPSGENVDGDTDGNGGGSNGGDATDLSDVFSGDCGKAIAAFASVQSSFAGGFGGSFGSDAIAETGDMLDELADAAPSDIKDAFEVLAEELGAYFEALGGLDLSGIASGQPDPAVISALTAASESVDEEALQSATEEIEAYFDGACTDG